MTCRKPPPPPFRPAPARRLAGTKIQIIATYQDQSQHATNGWAMSMCSSGFSSRFAPACVVLATRQADGRLYTSLSLIMTGSPSD